MRAELESVRTELGAEIARLKDQLLRALAEIENTRRRAEREREDTARYAISAFARDILTVADNLRRALDNIPAHAREKDEMLNTLAVGVEATERELLAGFERHGLRKIEPLGEKFDHNFHQAMFEIADTGKPPGTIVQVMQAGYVLHGRLLRPALVGVAKGEPAEIRVDATV
jgi:molecular chaperone GrpE